MTISGANHRAPSPDDARLPIGAEIGVGLWYLIDENGFIYSVWIHLYVCSGSEKEKLAFLASRAYLDYPVAKPFPIPGKYHTHYISPDGTETLLPCIHHDQLKIQGGPDLLIYDWLDEMERALPAQTDLKISESPLIVVRALTMDNRGRVVPVDSLAPGEWAGGGI